MFSFHRHKYFTFYVTFIRRISIAVFVFLSFRFANVLVQAAGSLFISSFTFRVHIKFDWPFLGVVGCNVLPAGEMKIEKKEREGHIPAVGRCHCSLMAIPAVTVPFVSPFRVLRHRCSAPFVVCAVKFLFRRRQKGKRRAQCLRKSRTNVVGRGQRRARNTKMGNEDGCRRTGIAQSGDGGECRREWMHTNSAACQHGIFHSFPVCLLSAFVHIVNSFFLLPIFLPSNVNFYSSCSC